MQAWCWVSVKSLWRLNVFTSIGKSDLAVCLEISCLEPQHILSACGPFTWQKTWGIKRHYNVFSFLLVIGGKLLWVLFSVLNSALSRCLRACSETPSSLPMGSPLQTKASRWPWSPNKKRCHDSSLTHRCFLIQAQGELLQLKPDCLQSMAWVCVCMCMFVFLRASPHLSVYVALSPFKIADKCRSLCLARLCMRIQWLGLQAVAQD